MVPGVPVERPRSPTCPEDVWGIKQKQRTRKSKVIDRDTLLEFISASPNVEVRDPFRTCSLSMKQTAVPGSAESTEPSSHRQSLNNVYVTLLPTVNAGFCIICIPEISQKGFLRAEKMADGRPAVQYVPSPL